ncbi:hypothetical protein [Microbacterium sp. K27]|uniref:hypothetical protein n=1 Tax=Microbacterium sp. K27 TaxID=2305445 RepID=UPI00109B9AE2|nr:hypothetical protein [Microbacterium sp. K27]
MLLAEGRAEASALADQATRTAREYRETGAEQPYQDELVALTARIKALPAEQAGTVIASLLGIIAWGRTS